jgi:hypothetical protein
MDDLAKNSLHSARSSLKLYKYDQNVKNIAYFTGVLLRPLFAFVAFFNVPFK